MSEAVGILDGARSELAKAIGDAASPEDALKRIGQWGPDGAAYAKLGDALFVPAVKADLAGQLMVRRGIGDGPIQMADPAQKPAFLDMPWDDAINEFKARGIVKPNELSMLLGDYAQRSDVARKLMLENIQKEVRAQLEKSLREGGTYQQFAAALDEKKVSLGIADTGPSYLNMVFRTNVQGAYGAGRFKAMMDPVVQLARPLVQYRTVGDARVRPEHAILDGTVYESNSEAWHHVCPPNSYCCRCGMVMLTREEGAGKQVLGAVPAEYVPDPDFNGPPVARLPASLPANNNATAPQVQVPEQLQPTPTAAPTPQAEPSKRLGETAANVFGRSLSDAEVDALAGKHAQLPDGYTAQVKVQELKPGERGALGTKTRPEPVVQVEGEIKNAAGDTAGSYARQFTRGDDGLAVHHSFFFVEDDEQGKGLGRQLFNSQVAAYQQQGVAKVTLNATDVGRYVWSKAGFEWSDPGQLEKALSQLSDLLTQRFGADYAGKIMSVTKTPSDIATLVINGEQIGKQFLIDLGEDVAMTQSPAKINRL